MGACAPPTVVDSSAWSPGSPLTVICDGHVPWSPSSADLPALAAVALDALPLQRGRCNAPQQAVPLAERLPGRVVRRGALVQGDEGHADDASVVQGRRVGCDDAPASLVVKDPGAGVTHPSHERLAADRALQGS